MKIGILKEIKDNENRVAVTPIGAYQLIKDGHEVFIETNAGEASGYPDEEYQEFGAHIVSAKEAWNVDMVVKVKEPLKSEYQYFREGLILFTYLHLAANKELTEELMKSKVTAVAYETVTDDQGGLPLLTPMSEIAGRMSVISGSQFLQSQYGGKGILISSVPGVRKGKVVIIGGGTVGINAAKIAVGLGAEVTVLDINPNVLQDIDNQFSGRVTTLFSNSHNIRSAVKRADLVIGAVLIAGSKAPTLVTEKMVKLMEEGSVIVDIPIDQGGIFETSDHATTLSDPVYKKEGVIHYTVANIPGAVGKTSTDALSVRTLPIAAKLAKENLMDLVKKNENIRHGFNVYDGKIVNQAVAKSLDLSYTALV